MVKQATAIEQRAVGWPDLYCQMGVWPVLPGNDSPCTIRNLYCQVGLFDLCWQQACKPAEADGQGRGTTHQAQQAIPGIVVIWYLWMHKN